MTDNRTGLHAPRDNSGNLYSISQLTVCYEPVVKISGYVYRDTNGSGTKDSNEVGLGGRSVNLSDGSTATSSSGSSTLGLYEALVPSGTYTLCSSAEPGVEVQTQPAPSTYCSGDGGWHANYTGDTADQNFGFAGGVEGSCGTADDAPLESSLESTGATVIAKFQAVDGNCKVVGKDLVFTTYSQSGGARVAQLSPVGSLGTATCERGSGTGCQIVAQKITWTLAGDSPDTSTLQYDDPPYGAFSAMKFCKKDPLDHSVPDDGVTLKTVGSGYYPTDILPGTETSCLIVTTQGPGPSPKRIDQVYSAYDGKISFG